MTIAEFMEKKSLTTEEFARLVGVSKSIVRLWECGASSPRLLHAMRIYNQTKKKVTLKEMLSTKDAKGLSTWK